MHALHGAKAIETMSRTIHLRECESQRNPKSLDTQTKTTSIIGWLFLRLESESRAGCTDGSDERPSRSTENVRHVLSTKAKRIHVPWLEPYVAERLVVSAVEGGRQIHHFNCRPPTDSSSHRAMLRIGISTCLTIMLTLLDIHIRVSLNCSTNDEMSKVVKKRSLRFASLLTTEHVGLHKAPPAWINQTNLPGVK
jgi:hypothetical protein